MEVEPGLRASVPRPSSAGLQQALTHPRVVGLAGLLNIDLNNQALRNALLAQAEQQLNQLAAIDATADAAARSGEESAKGAAEGASVSPADPQRPITPYRVREALRSYREIAAL